MWHLSLFHLKSLFTSHITQTSYQYWSIQGYFTANLPGYQCWNKLIKILTGYFDTAYLQSWHTSFVHVTICAKGQSCSVHQAKGKDTWQTAPLKFSIVCFVTLSCAQTWTYYHQHTHLHTEYWFPNKQACKSWPYTQFEHWLRYKIWQAPTVDACPFINNDVNFLTVHIILRKPLTLTDSPNFPV